jgi:hypothetical protein
MVYRLLERDGATGRLAFFSGITSLPCQVKFHAGGYVPQALNHTKEQQWMCAPPA